MCVTQTGQKQSELSDIVCLCVCVCLTQFWGQDREAVALDVQLLELGQISNLFGERDEVIIPQTQLQREGVREGRERKRASERERKRTREDEGFVEEDKEGGGKKDKKEGEK